MQENWAYFYRFFVEWISFISNIYEEVYDCHPSEKESTLKELISNFIDDKSIRIDENKWTQTRELYNGFIESCHDIRVLSLKKFSQILSTLLGVKPVRGGPKKDLMGFRVEFKPFGFF